MLDIEKILLDIYALEPSLKEKEFELRKIIKEIAALKPDTKFDQQFYNQLKIKLMDKVNLPKEDVRGFWQELFAKKLILVPVAMAVLAIMIVPTIMNKKKTTGGQVVALADRAFGALGVSGSGSAEKGSGISSPEATSFSRPQSGGGMGGLGGGGGAGSVMPAPATDIAVGSGKMIAPGEYQQYVFEYKGETLILDKDKMDVMRRLKNTAIVSGEMSSILANAGFGTMNWNKLSGMKLQNVSMTENKQGGMSVYVGVEEGSISINKNYDYARCMSIECGVRPLSESDMPKDERVIEAADQFLSEYGIDKKNYGKPEVQNEWRMYLNAASAETRPSFYFPETISVTYPQLVNGKEVYDESGNKNGLVVNVDIREMKGAGLWNLFSQKHESSAYDVETDTARLIKLAEQGGFRRGYYYADSNQVEVKKNVIELGTPSIGLVKMWIYNEKGGQELVVPAYIFPVTNKPEGAYFYQKNVVVPLVKEILDQEQNQPVPIMMKGAVEPVKASSDGTATMIVQ